MANLLRLLVQERVMGVADLIRTVIRLAGKCGFVGRGAAEVGGRRLCQVSGGWARRSTVRSTGSLRPGTDRAQRRSWGWAPVDLVLSSKVWLVHF